MAKIVAFANQKGGVGKTTSCVNMAEFLALMGKKVLLIDMDPQGNATTALGHTKEKGGKSIYNAIVGSAAIFDVVFETNTKGLSLVPSSIDLAGVEVEMVYMQNRETVLKTLFEQLKSKFDYILVDCPPSLGLLTINALTASNSVLIPLHCEFFALEGLTQLMNTIRLVKKHLNPELAIEGVVLTMRDKRSNLGNQVADEIRNYFNESLFETAIPRNVRLAEAPSHGEAIFSYDKSCSGATAYQQLTEEFLKRNNDSYKKITKQKKTKGVGKK